MRIEYPMSVDYVKNWKVWEVVREFLQNAMDAGEYEYTYEGGGRILYLSTLEVSIETCYY